MKIKDGKATVAEKRKWLMNVYDEMDKGKSGTIPKVFLDDRKKTYGGWVKDVLDNTVWEDRSSF